MPWPSAESPTNEGALDMVDSTTTTRPMTMWCRDHGAIFVKEKDTGKVAMTSSSMPGRREIPAV